MGSVSLKGRRHKIWFIFFILKTSVRNFFWVGRGGEGALMGGLTMSIKGSKGLVRY